MSENSITVPVVLAADNVMAMPLGVCIASIVASKAPETALELHVLSFGISATNRRKLSGLAVNGVKLFWYDVAADQQLQLKKFYTRSERHYPPAAYARLLIGDVLPASLSQALYIDVDTVVLADLEPLISIDMGNNFALASRDLIDQGTEHLRLTRILTTEDVERFGIETGGVYFNSGVMVFDLSAFRDGAADEMFDLMWRYPQFDYPDQDALNIVFSGRIGLISPRWNQTSAVFYPEVERDMPYSEEEFTALRKDPFIIHYTGNPKPWRSGCTHPMAHEWEKFRLLTPWGNLHQTNWRRFLAAAPRVKRLLLKKARRAFWR